MVSLRAESFFPLLATVGSIRLAVGGKLRA